MKYHVYVRSSAMERHQGVVGSFVVTDRPDDLHDEVHWPIAAEFDVNQRHDQETQQRRAHEYAEYLNRIAQPQPSISDVMGS